MGLIDLFNGMYVKQTRDYVKISCQTYLERIMPKHLDKWMTDHHMPASPTPLPTRNKFIENFFSASGSDIPDEQKTLASKMGFEYCSGIGEAIYAMVTCGPDISFGITAASQQSARPAKIHYHGMRHLLKYRYLFLACNTE